MDILDVSHISKSFGNHTVLKDLSFSVPEHSIYGFIGKNGAGKTTAMKMVLGLYPMDQGEIKVCGEKASYGQNRTNRYIGYLPDVPEFYGFMTPPEYLWLCGKITGMPKSVLNDRIPEMLKVTGLYQEKRRIQGFSRGMKQRLGIAQALINRPRLLICDEPTSALDPAGRKEILDILKSVREYTTILFSTHILSDVERICDEIGILNGGKLAWHGTMEDIHHMGQSQGFEIDFQNAKDAQRLAMEWDGAKRTNDLQLIFEGESKNDMNKVMEQIAAQNIPVRRIERMEPSLEAFFMEVIEK